MITDVRNQKSWLWRHCRRRAIYWLLRSPQTCHAKPKLKSTGAGRYQLLPVGGMPTASSLPKDFPKVRTLWHCSRLRSVALPGDTVVISVRQSTVAAISGLHCRALVMVSKFEHKADSLIAKFKEAGETVREIDVWAESPRSPLWLSASSACLSWAVNHYRDNAITYKAQRDKNARELLANAAITTCRCVSVMLSRWMQNTRRS